MADTASRVESVELFEDRASVTRVVDLPRTGTHDLLVTGLSPLVQDRGLSFVDVPHIRVDEMRVSRTRLERDAAETARLRALRQGHDEAAAVAHRAELAVTRAKDAAQRLDRLAGLATTWTGRAWLEHQDAAAHLRAAQDIHEARLAARWRQADLEMARDEAQRESIYASGLYGSARVGTTQWAATLHLRLRVLAPGELRLRYTVPCAVWRPVHRAASSKGELRWTVGAMAWNATGEHWSGIALRFSTARPGEDPQPPRLEDDVLHARPRGSAVVVEAREEQVSVAREGGTRTLAELPGVEDGGQARVFDAPSTVDLPSDGRPIVVPLETWTTRTASSWVAHPERAAEVVLRTRQHQGGTRPLLAGPVELLRDGAVAGRTRVGYVPVGEAFALGWGAHDALRMTRRLDHVVDRTRITGRHLHAFTVKLRLANSGDEPVDVEIRERVPVSELKEVRVTQVQARPALSEGPDADGFCTWRLRAEPRSVAEIELQYTVEASSKVVLPW